jgi:hypothetical protein
VIFNKSPNLQQRQGELKAQVQICRGITFKDVLQQSEKFKTHPITNKFVLSSEGLFEEPRHDFYITLEGGEFKEGQNIEIVIDVRFSDGERLKVCLL